MRLRSNFHTQLCPERERKRRVTAFSLLEVMIACGIFFIAVFAILALVSNTLRNAQHLRRVELDTGTVFSYLLRTNRFTEGTETIDMADFGYPDYSATVDAAPDEVFTNGLWNLTVVLNKRGMSQPIDVRTMSIYSPASTQSRFGQMRRP